MAVATQSVAAGVALYALIAVSPVVVIWTAVRLPHLFGYISDRWTTRQQRQQLRRPQGPPLEDLVADLRRLRAELVDGRPTTNVRRTGLLMAYDSVLQGLCDRLEIPNELNGLTGGDLELERLRIEAAIQEAGISLSAHRRRAQP